jgi:hypothetical protein
VLESGLSKVTVRRDLRDLAAEGRLARIQCNPTKGANDPAGQRMYRPWVWANITVSRFSRPVAA